MESMRDHRALSLPETVAALAAAALLLVLTIPVIGSVGRDSRVQQSMSNLGVLNQADQLYAADWGGRQYTAVVDDLAAYGSVAAYQSAVGWHPPILLGWECFNSSGALVGYWMHFTGNHNLVWPINPTNRLGWFRLTNAKPFHDYVGGRFYEDAFYAPADEVPFQTTKNLRATECEWIDNTGSGLPYWSSYAFSPAGLFHPDVLDRENPQLSADMAVMPDNAFECPSFSQARHASLKTRIIEHHWNQNPPASCNPAFVNGVYDGCEPYYFNHGMASSPVSLFYDGSIRLFPNTEAVAADEAVAKSLGSFVGLWFKPGGPHLGGALGSDGYFNGAAFEEGLAINHTILTIDGILGRDTIEGARP